MPQTRRHFLRSSATANGLLPSANAFGAQGTVYGKTPLLTPIHSAVVCPWTPKHWPKPFPRFAPRAHPMVYSAVQEFTAKTKKTTPAAPRGGL